MTRRAIILGLLLVPLQVFWIVHMELVRGGIWPSVLSLLFTSVFILFVVALANLPLRRYLPHQALRDDELVGLYIVLAVGASLAGCDVGQTLVNILPAPYHYATAENGWEQRFHRWLPAHLLVDDEHAAKGFYRGADTIYRWSSLRAWVRPVLGWATFTALMLFTTLQLNLLVRRQWIEAERLTFPVVQTPLAMTRSESFWRQRGLWWGFGLAGGITLLNGLHELVPAAPVINCKQTLQLGAYFTSHPWRAIGWWPLTLYPFAIGLGYLMPADMSLSCVVGFFVWKAQRVLFEAAGVSQGWLAAAHAQPQVSGTWLAILAYSLWTARRAWLRDEPSDAEPPARRRLVWLLAGFAGMVVWGHQAGMRWGYAVAHWLLYLAFYLALTRMRAEVGPPCHDLYAAGPDQILTTWLGVGAVHPRNLTAMAVFYWLAREAPRSHPMPHQLEALHLAGAAGLSKRRVAVVVLVAGMASYFATFWAVLHCSYVHGAEGRMDGPARWFATEGFRRLDSQLTLPPERSAADCLAMVLALVVSLLCLALRSRVLAFPLHPAGYAISSWWAIHLLWCPLLIAWMVKQGATRYGGARLYRRWRPFFFGLLLGDFVVGSVWQIAGLLGGFRAYAFWI